MRDLRIVPALLAAFAGFAPVAAAQAATPFTAGSGDMPVVAVGSDGTGHVAWVTTGDDVKVGYCRVPAGGSACDRTELLAFGAASGARAAGQPLIFAAAPSRVVVVAHCSQCGASTQNRTYRWVSTDGGASFGAPVHIGDLPPEGSYGHGAWLDSDNVFVGTGSAKVKATRDATEPGGGVVYAGGGGFVYDPQVVRVPGTAKLVAATHDLDEVRYAVYTGASTAPAAINDPGNWLVNRSLTAAEAANTSTALNAGPNGVFLSYEHAVTGNGRVALRRFDPATNEFGAAAYVAGGGIDADPDDVDSFQDAAGRIHLVWRSLHDGGRLRYTVSDTGAGSFTQPGNLALREDFTDPEVAAGPGGSGFAVWTKGAWGDVRVVALDPQPEPAPPAPPPAPPAGGGPASPAPAATPPAEYAGARRTSRLRLAGAWVVATRPRACVIAGQAFRVSVRSTPRGRLRIRRVVFRLGRRTIGSDRRAPFVRRIVVPASTRPGSAVRLRLTVAARRGARSRLATRTFSLSIRVCG